MPEKSLDEIMDDAYEEAIKEKKEPEEAEEVEEDLTEEESVVEDATEEVVEDIVEDEPEVVAPVSKAPDHWSAGAKAHWEKLPPDVRAAALKQVEYANSLQSRFDKERNAYEAIEKILEPRRSRLSAMYGNEAKALEQLFALSDFAEKDPRGFLEYFAQQRGIDLRGQAQTGQQQIDPNVTALQQQLAQTQQSIQSMQQAQNDAVYQQVEQSFNEFVSSNEAPYLEDVKEDMAFLLENGKATSWKSAYDMAIKLNPAVSELMEGQKLKALDEERKAKAKEATEKAKKAQSKNVSSKGVTASKVDVSGDWMDTVDSVGSKLMGA